MIVLGNGVLCWMESFDRDAPAGNGLRTQSGVHRIMIVLGDGVLYWMESFDRDAPAGTA